MPPSAPPTIPGYRLDREIGRGGMGVVYRAERVDDGAQVALKVIQPHLADDPRYRRRLREEARRAATVRHPAIVQVHDLGEEGDALWIAMELIEGPDIQRLVETRGPLPPAFAAELVAQTAGALADVHAAGLVHRDVKPANILLDPALDPADEPPRARLADFGIAHALAEVGEAGLSDAESWARTTGDADTGARAGTFAYMAPEQWRGESPTPRTDVYALGATLYMMLTGKPPFTQGTLYELAHAVATSTPPNPSRTAPDVPAAFDSVVTRAMAKDPADRYPSAEELARAVRAAAQGRPDPQAPTLDGPRRPRWTRCRVLAATSAAVALVAAGVTATVVWSSSDGGDGDGGGGEREGIHRAVVCVKKDITLRDRPSGTPLRTLGTGTGVNVHRDRGRGAWWYVSTDDGHSGWALSQHLPSTCALN